MSRCPEQVIPTLYSLDPHVQEANTIVAKEAFRVLREEVIFGRDTNPKIGIGARRFLNAGIISPESS